MMKIATAIALTLCCVSFNGYAQEQEVSTPEVSIDVEPCSEGTAEVPQNTDETDKGGN